MAKAIKSALIAALVTFVTFVVLGPAGLGLSLGVSATTAAVVSGVTTLIASGVAMLTSKGIEANAGNLGTKLTSRNATAGRQIVYGECRVGGTILHMQTSGTDNHMLHMIVAIAGHEIEELKAIRFNDINITLGSNTSTSTIGGQTVHTVTHSKFTNTDNDNAFTSGRLVRFSFNDGSQTTADGFARNQLASIPTTHKYTDTAYIYIQMVYDPEKLPQPPQLSYHVKGKKVFDPRSGNTAYSNNPALIIRDFVTDTTYGLKATTSEVNDTTAAGGFASAANTCDQQVTLENGSSTETRYTANGFTTMIADPEGILEGLLASCAGKMTFTNGKFNLFAGAAQTASMTITDDVLLGTPQISTKPLNGDMFNASKPVFVDAANNFTGTDGGVFTDTTALAADTPSGESSANYIKMMEVQMPYVTSRTQADRLAKIALRHSRQSTTMQVLTTIEFMKLQPCDYVRVTNERLDYTNKLFEVVSTNLEIVEDGDVPTMATALQLKEIDSSVYNHAFNEYSQEIDEGSDVSDTNRVPAAPTSLSATTLTFNVYVVNQRIIRANWTNSTSELVTGTELSYKLTSDSDYTLQPMIPKGVAVGFIPNVQTGQQYDVRVRHLNIHGIYSSYATVQHTVSGSAQSNTDLQNDAITIDSSNGQISGIGTGNNSRVFNDIIDIDLATSGSNIGRVTIGGIGSTNNFIDVTKSNLALDYFDGANKTEFDSLTAQDGKIGIKNNNASSFTLLEPFTSAELTKLVNLRAGTAPDDANVSIKNDGITINSSTGVIGGIGTGSGSRVFNDVIGIALDTTNNVGRVSISGIGSSNTFVDVTKGNLGLLYDDGATVGARFGSNLFDSDGTTNLTANQIKNGNIGVDSNGRLTNTGTGTTIFSNDKIVSGDLAGTGKAFTTLPESGATVGARFGTNLFDTDGSTNLTANQIKNGNIGVDSNGRLTNTGTGTTVFSNAKIVSGDLAGTGKAFSILPASGATVGAVLGTNLTDSGGNSLGDEDVRNSDLSLAYSGTSLQIRKGSTQIGSNLAAANGLVNSRIQMNTNGSLTYNNNGTGNPTMNTLTDGNNIRSRLTAGLNSSGDVIRTVGKNVGGFGQDVSAATGIPDFTSGTLNIRTTVPPARGGFGIDIAGTFGNTAGILPRWNGSSFENLAEGGLLNSGITINSDGEISGIGTGAGTFVDNSLTGNSRTLTINSSSAAYNSARGLPNGSDTTGKTYLIGTTGLPTYGSSTYDSGHKVAPSAFFIESVQSGGYNKITLKNFQFGVTGNITFTASGKGSTGGNLLIYVSAGISSSSSSYNQVTNGDIGEVLALSQFSTATTFTGGFSVLVNELEINVPQASQTVTGTLWLWCELFVSSVTAVSSTPKIQLVDRTDSQIILGRTTGGAQTGNYSHSTSTHSIARS